jgi:hypothetical protein
LVENMIITDKILARTRVFQQKTWKKTWKMKKLLPVDDDYLLLDYYYFVVWRASCTKRVKRDYFYLDYSFLGSARLLILTSMRLSRRSGTWKFEPEVWTIGVLQTIPFPALGATLGPRGGAADAKKRDFP